MNPLRIFNSALRSSRAWVASIPLLACSTGMALTADLPMLQTAAPTIDGELETAYTIHPGYPIANTIGEGQVDNYQDFRARWWGVWDETNLYIFIKVTDQFLTDSHGDAPFQNDVVEVYFNMDNVRDPAGNARTGDNYQYAFHWNKPDEENVSGDGSFEGVEWTQVNTDTGYNIEVLFPWATLTTLGIEEGMDIGFDIAINDNDGQSTYDAITYWYSDASLWGNMDPAGTVRLSTPAGFTRIPEVNEADVPTVDGVVDPIYAANSGNDIQSVAAGVVESATDFSAQWWGLWDADKFYLVIQVHDQFLTSTAGAAVYQNDVVEVYFNMDNVRFPAGNARTGDNYQYSFKWNNPDENAVSGSATMDGVEFAETTTEDGYIMEIAFPWTTLTTELTPAEDFQFGFDVAINDNDGKPANDSTRYWHSTKALWGNMDTAGTVELDPAFGGNYPPVIAPLEIQSVDNGVELAFNVTATDPDVDDTITFTAEYLPDFITLTDDGAGVATLTATPVDAPIGIYEFNLIASDGERSDSEIITLVVTDPEVAMQAPMFMEPYSVALNAGDSVTFDVGVVDLDSVNVVVDDAPQGFARLAPLAEDATAPAVDGVIEDTYSSAIGIGRVIGDGVVTDATDFSASWQGTWDDENFYLVIDVTDESLNDTAGAAAWQNDTVEVYFNMDNVRNPAGNARSQDNYQYAFHWNKPDEQNVTDNGSFEGVQWTQVDTDDGYTVEVLFPWATLTHLTVDEGFIFGFDIAINDNDGGETYDGIIYWASDHSLWGNMDGTGAVMLGVAPSPSIATVTPNGDKSATVTITTTEETELGDYTVTIIARDESGNMDVLNLPVSVTPDTWNGFPREGDWVETGSFLGMIYVGDEPWIYIEGAATWFYLAQDTFTAEGAWIFSYDLVAGDPNTTNDDLWVGYGIDTGWAITPLGAIYVEDVAPWGYVNGFGSWAYIPADQVTETGAWIYAANTNPEP